MSESLYDELGHHLLDELQAGRLTRGEFIRRGTVLGLSSAALLGLLGERAQPASAAPAAVTRGGTMRVSLIPPSSNLDPVLMFDEGSIGTVQQIAEYLAWTEPNLTLRPVLAQSWTADSLARTWTFALRKGVTFSNGQPLTADDVVATFNRLTDPKSASSALSNFKTVLSHGNVEKIDAHTVAFHLDRSFTDFPYFVASTNYNAVVLPANYAGDFRKNPIGTGPFLLQNYVPQQSATFRRNPTYWQPGLPYLDGVTLRYFEQTQPQVLALEGGEVDMMIATPYQSSLAFVSNPNIKLLSTRTTSYRNFSMKVDRAPFNDKRVRQAIAMCLDRPAIISLLFGGKADIGNDEMFASVLPHSPTLPQRKQDYQQAKQLLAAAGHPNGLTFTITTEDYLEIGAYAQAVQQMLLPAGLQTQLLVMTPAAYGGSGNNQPWLDVTVGIQDWGARAVVSQLILPAFTCSGIWNASHYCNPRFDKLMTAYVATLDQAQRTKLATEIALIQQDETPSIIAYWINVLRAVKTNVHGVTADGLNFLDLTRAWLG